MTNQHEFVDVTTTPAKPRRFVFVLLDQFSLLSFASALDSLRIANRMSAKPLYEWILAGEGGDTVRCSAGTEFKVEIGLEDMRRDDTILLCGGVDIHLATTKKLLNWVRREARRASNPWGAVFGHLYIGQGWPAGWQTRHHPLGKPR